MTNDIICVECPLGCQLEVSAADQSPRVTGNLCARGVDYAIRETRFPGRTLTTTVETTKSTGPLLPVRSSSKIPQGRLIECMEVIAKHRVSLPVKRGVAVIENILGLGINIIATCSRK
jgi:CxxC motif-containing protein